MSRTCQGLTDGLNIHIWSFDIGQPAPLPYSELNIPSIKSMTSALKCIYQGTAYHFTNSSIVELTNFEQITAQAGTRYCLCTKAWKSIEDLISIFADLDWPVWSLQGPHSGSERDKYQLNTSHFILFRSRTLPS